MKVFLSELRLYICNHVVCHIPSHNFRLWYYKNVMGFQIGKGSSVFMNCKFDCAKGLTIGSNSVVNSNCRLDPRGGLIIGDNVSISNDIVILTADHDLNTPDFAGRNRAVVIEDYVWIGTRAMLLPGVSIRKGALVAAGSVVTKNVESLQVVGGVPAKLITIRNSELGYKVSYQRLFQ
jgi:acetyltransferase-like isoleucine patch superfamily enzyme